jgi:hypothetical protein
MADTCCCLLAPFLLMVAAIGIFIMIRVLGH